MNHPHQHTTSATGHTHGHPGHSDTQALGWAFCLNLAFVLIELFGAMYTHSLAVLSNAVHDLGDSVALALGWYFEKFSHKQRDQTYTYGYRRWSVASAIFSSLILFSGSVLILKEAIPRLWEAQPVAGPGMIVLACLGVLANALAMSKLHEHGSPAEKTIRLHLLEDVLGWVAVLVGAVVLQFTGWFWLDPVLSIGVTVFILRNVLANFKTFSRILLQGVPKDVVPDQLQAQIQGVPGVQAIHDLHLWTLDSLEHVLSLHVVIAPVMTRQEFLAIKATVRVQLRAFGIAHTTLEMEYTDEVCDLKLC